MDQKSIEQLLKIKALLAGQKPVQKFDGGGQVQPSPSPSPTDKSPALDPDKVKQFQSGFNAGDVSLSQAYNNARKALGLSNGGLVQHFVDGGDVKSLSDMSPEDLKALFAKNSDSVDDSAGSDAPVSGKDAPAPADDGYDDLRDKLNTLSDKATQAGQAAADESSGKDSAPANIPLPNGGLSGDALAQAIKANPGPVATTGFNPSALPVAPDLNRDVAGDDEEEDDAPAKAKAKAALQDTSSPVASLLQKMQQQQTQEQDPNDPFSQGALQNAQNVQKQLTMMGGMGAAGDTIAKALSRGAYQGSPEFWQNYQKNVAPQAVNQLLQKQQVAEAGTEHQIKSYALADDKEKNDPNSAASQLAKTVLQASAKQAGFSIPGDLSKMTASSIEKTAPWVAKIIDSKMAADARASSLAFQHSFMQEKLDDQRAKNMQNLVTSGSKAINPNAARTGNLGQLATRLNRADYLQALAMDPTGAPKNLNPQQMTELSMSLGNLISGQNGVSVETLRHIMPTSAMGSAAAALQWLTSKPQGAGQQSFVKLMLDTAQREKAVTSAQLKNAQYGAFQPVERNILHAHGVSDEDKQDAIKQILNSQGLDPDEYSTFKTGKRLNPVQAGITANQNAQRGPSASPQSSALSPEDQQAITWANANPTDPRAAKILALHGMK